jgi:rubrerythrin
MKKLLLRLQRDEAESLLIYTQLAKREKIKKNKKVLESIASDELTHYTMIKEITGRDVKARKWRVSMYVLISKILGLTFGLKLMEL